MNTVANSLSSKATADPPSEPRGPVEALSAPVSVSPENVRPSSGGRGSLAAAVRWLVIDGFPGRPAGVPILRLPRSATACRKLVVGRGGEGGRGQKKEGSL